MDSKNKEQIKEWNTPTVKTVSLQELSSLITASACSFYSTVCLFNMR